MNLVEAYKKRLAISESVYGKAHNGEKMSNNRKIVTAKCLSNVEKFLNEAFDNSVGTQRSDLYWLEAYGSDAIWKVCMGYIYKITNTINNKNYIGQTSKDLDKRFKQHLSFERKDDNKNYFHSAIKKYGKDCFICEKIEEVDDSMLDEREIYWINYYKSIGEAQYNIAGGGYNSPFMYMSDDKKSAIAIKARNTFLKNHSEEDILQINKSKAMVGEKNPNFGGSEKHRTGCKEYYSNNPFSHKGEKNPFYNKHHSDKTKELISKKLAGNHNHPQNGENNTNYGKHGIDSANHKEVVITFSDGSSKCFGSRKELGEYIGYSNGNKPPMNKILKSKKFPKINGAIVTYK